MLQRRSITVFLSIAFAPQALFVLPPGLPLSEPLSRQYITRYAGQPRCGGPAWRLSD
jgi:hypothetical protein